jgi:hypothetical protein
MSEPVSLREYVEALRVADQRFEQERDRRYAEVALEREKALKIKETADLAALQLAREFQKERDEKANELRSQIERERGDYPTRSELATVVDKFEAALRPVTDYITSLQARAEQSQDSREQAGASLGLWIAVGVLVVAVIGLVVGTL